MRDSCASRVVLPAALTRAGIFVAYRAALSRSVLCSTWGGDHATEASTASVLGEFAETLTLTFAERNAGEIGWFLNSNEHI